MPVSTRDGDTRQPTLVVIPTYKERTNIEVTITQLLAASAVVDVLVIDDSSPDGTTRIAERVASENERVHVLVRPRKMGLGTAYVTGFGWGIERGYETLVEMDADLSHDPAEVSRLLAALSGADLVIGSRYVDGGRVVNWGIARRLLSRAANIYVGLWLRLGVKDATSGYRAWRAAILPALDLQTVRSEGYGFQIEMTRRLVRCRGRVSEVPITFHERAGGASKMDSRIVLEALVSVTKWGVLDTLGALRKKR
jgi:dolichol-phosphate mannosyltransferase